jgi:hypothetical protein
MANYGNIVRNTSPSADGGGYKNTVLICPRADFLTFGTPTETPTALGDSLTISTAHTFTTPKGFFSWGCKQHSVTLKSTSVGDDGAREQEWSSEFIILGDNASTQEQLERTLNDDVILLLKEASCVGTDAYVQLGDECVSPTFSVEFDGKTTKEGKKEYKVTVTCKKKYFYSATVTMAA